MVSHVWKADWADVGDSQKQEQEGLIDAGDLGEQG